MKSKKFESYEFLIFSDHAELRKDDKVIFSIKGDIESFDKFFEVLLDRNLFRKKTK